MLINEVINKNSIINTIQTKCSDILSVYQKNQVYLYHGGKLGDTPQMFKTEKKRIPKDTPENIQKFVDQLLKKAGFTALRSNSLFCTGDINEAWGYGSYNAPYIIFPFNGFQFTWSKIINDFTLYFGLTDMFIANEYFALVNGIPKPTKTLTDMTPKQFISKFKFSNTNITAAIKSKQEILISGKFIAVPLIPKNKKILTKFLKLNF